MAPRRDKLFATKVTGRRTALLQKAKAKAETSRASPSAEQKQLNKVTDPTNFNPSQPIRKRQRKAAAIPAVEARWDRRADEPPSVLPPEPPLLSRIESQRLRTIYEEVMARIACRTTGSEDSKTRSSNTNAKHYRYRDLKQVNVILHAVPPDEVETTIKGIVNAEAPDRRAELQKLAQDLCKSFTELVRGANNERAFLEPVNDALKALHHDNLHIIREETWNRALKPVAQSPVKVNVPTPRQDLSTENPLSDDCSPVRTPRPDISMGITEKALIYALSLQGLGMDDATEFIETLQTKMVQHEPNRPFEPVLPLIPTDIGSTFTFPFAVIEGKSYCTGRQIFEAENQAAGAMACAHNLLLHLDRTANGYSQPRVLFSFATEGPIIELWAHWTDLKGKRKRTFESKLWGIWNVLLPEHADDFIEKLNAVCDWGTGQFMDSVVEQLGKIADRNLEFIDCGSADPNFAGDAMPRPRVAESAVLMPDSEDEEEEDEEESAAQEEEDEEESAAQEEEDEEESAAQEEEEDEEESAAQEEDVDMQEEEQEDDREGHGAHLEVDVVPSSEEDASDDAEGSQVHLRPRSAKAVGGPPLLNSIPLYRACESCRKRHKKCPHKQLYKLPKKSDGPNARPRPRPVQLPEGFEPPPVSKKRKRR